MERICYEDIVFLDVDACKTLFVAARGRQPSGYELNSMRLRREIGSCSRLIVKVAIPPACDQCQTLFTKYRPCGICGKYTCPKCNPCPARSCAFCEQLVAQQED